MVSTASASMASPADCSTPHAWYAPYLGGLAPFARRLLHPLPPSVQLVTPPPRAAGDSALRLQPNIADVSGTLYPQLVNPRFVYSQT